MQFSLSLPDGETVIFFDVPEGFPIELHGAHLCVAPGVCYDVVEQSFDTNYELDL